MGRAGQRFRVHGRARCSLHLDGLEYHGEIENISLGGALVRLDNGVPDSVRPGCGCGLRLGSGREESPVAYACRVARLAPSGVGVQILELSYGPAPHGREPSWQGRAPGSAGPGGLM